MKTRKVARAHEMNETQMAYAIAKAAYDTAIEAHNAEVKAAGWWESGDDAALDAIEASAEKHDTSRLFDLLRKTERAMVAWSLAHARAFAPEKASELAVLDHAERRPQIWSRLVDVAFRLAA